MAREIVGASIFDIPRDNKGFEARYPWDQWTNGSLWQATEGEDFTCSLRSFISNLQTVSRKRGLKVHTRRLKSIADEGTTIITVAFQFLPKDDLGDTSNLSIEEVV